MKPLAQSGWPMRSLDQADHQVIRHELPRLHDALGLLPSGLPDFTAARSMSPVDSWTMPTSL
jgi:hypothetical protein